MAVTFYGRVDGKYEIIGRVSHGLFSGPELVGQMLEDFDLRDEDELVRAFDNYNVYAVKT